MKPPSHIRQRHNPQTAMELKDILAMRLRALMDARPDLDTQTKVSKRAGVSQSTVQRVLNREVATNLDVISDLAKCFRVSPQDLLAPMPADRVTERVVPSYDEQELLLAWRGLSDADKHRIMAFVSISLAAEKKGADKKEARGELNVDEVKRVPAAALAAVRRTSVREPDKPTPLTKREHGTDQQTKRKGRHS